MELLPENTLEMFPYLSSQRAKNLDKIAENVVHLLISGNLHISVAESCTGGLISQLITSVSGASQIYEMGLCAYADRIKHEFLGVPKEELLRYTAVSAPVAASMAKGIRERSGSDLSISVTGLAGPGGGTPSQPVGTVYLGFSCPKGTESHLLQGLLLLPQKDRESIRLHTALAAFLLIEQKLKHDELFIRKE